MPPPDLSRAATGRGRPGGRAGRRHRVGPREHPDRTAVHLARLQHLGTLAPATSSPLAHSRAQTSSGDRPSAVTTVMSASRLPRRSSRPRARLASSLLPSKGPLHLGKRRVREVERGGRVPGLRRHPPCRSATRTHTVSHARHPAPAPPRTGGDGGVAHFRRRANLLPESNPQQISAATTTPGHVRGPLPCLAVCEAAAHRRAPRATRSGPCTGRSQRLESHDRRRSTASFHQGRRRAYGPPVGVRTCRRRSHQPRRGSCLRRLTYWCFRVGLTG